MAANRKSRKTQNPSKPGFMSRLEANALPPKRGNILDGSTHSAEPPVNQCSATPKEINDAMQDTFKKVYDTLVDSEFRHGALVALALGWIVTAEQAQKLFKQSWQVCVVFSVVGVLYTVIHAVWTAQYYFRSDAAHKRLVELAYMPVNSFEFNLISKPLAITFCVMNATGTGLLVFVIWYIFIWQ